MAFGYATKSTNLTLSATGKFILDNKRVLKLQEPSEGLVLTVSYRIPPAHESIVITASALDPTIDRRNDAVYSKTLFSRDDQIFDTLAAGINTGQHEGGGKSWLRYWALVEHRPWRRANKVRERGRCTSLCGILLGSLHFS